MANTTETAGRFVDGEPLHALAADIHQVPPAEVGRLRDDLLTRLAEWHATLAEVLRELADETLAVAVQKGLFAREAFEELLGHRYLERSLPRWLARWGASPDQALDVAQELILRFWETRLAQYEPSRSFAAYCYRAARFRWIDLLRGQRHERSLETSSENIASREPEPELVAIQRELWQRVAGCLPSLQGMQGPIVEQLLAGKSPQEIAQTLNLELPVVYRELYAARRALERRLELGP